MASKKKTSKKLTKSEFIRSKPKKMQAKEVVAQAAKLGMKFTENYVYTIRRAAALRAERKVPPAKVGRPRGPQGPVTKSAFIRQQPPELPARQVVDLARDAGIEITEHYVYKIRGSAPTRRASVPQQAAAVAAGAAAAASTPRVSLGRDTERTFRQLVISLGLDRSRALISEVEAGLSALITGG